MIKCMYLSENEIFVQELNFRSDFIRGEGREMMIEIGNSRVSFVIN